MYMYEWGKCLCDKLCAQMKRSDDLFSSRCARQRQAASGTVVRCPKCNHSSVLTNQTPLYACFTPRRPSPQSQLPSPTTTVNTHESSRLQKWDGQTNDNDNAHCRCFSSWLLRFILYAKIYHILHPAYRTTRSLYVIFFSNMLIYLKQDFSGCYCCRHNQLAHTTGTSLVSHCSDCHSYGPVELFVCVPAALNYPAC